MTKAAIASRIIYYQLMAFGLLMFLIVGDEMFDFPHTVFGGIATPINWFETYIEGMYVLLLGSLSIFFSRYLLMRIKYLEGIVPICSFCKKIRHGEDWKSLEEYISSHSEALFSHGVCPECAKKHYGKYIREQI